MKKTLLGSLLALALTLAFGTGCQTPSANPVSSVSVTTTYDPLTDVVGGGIAVTFKGLDGTRQTAYLRGVARMQTRPLSEILALAKGVYSASLTPPGDLDTTRIHRLAAAAGTAFSLHPDEVSAFAGILRSFVELKVASF